VAEVSEQNSCPHCTSCHTAAAAAAAADMEAAVQLLLAEVAVVPQQKGSGVWGSGGHEADKGAACTQPWRPWPLSMYCSSSTAAVEAVVQRFWPVCLLQHRLTRVND
jgi:AhpD family alkylhydroperoxidase